MTSKSLAALVAYTTLTPVDHDGERLGINKPLFLTAAQAEQLLGCDAIRLGSPDEAQSSAALLASADADADLIARLQAAVDQLDAEKQSLLIELDGKVQDLAALNDQLIALQAEHATALENLTVLTTSNQQLQEQLAAQATELADVKAQLAEALADDETPPSGKPPVKTPAKSTTTK